MFLHTFSFRVHLSSLMMMIHTQPTRPNHTTTTPLVRNLFSFLTMYPSSMSKGSSTSTSTAKSASEVEAVCVSPGVRRKPLKKRHVPSTTTADHRKPLKKRRSVASEKVEGKVHVRTTKLQRQVASCWVRIDSATNEPKQGLMPDVPCSGPFLYDDRYTKMKNQTIMDTKLPAQSSPTARRLSLIDDDDDGSAEIQSIQTAAETVTPVPYLDLLLASNDGVLEKELQSLTRRCLEYRGKGGAVATTTTRESSSKTVTPPPPSCSANPVAAVCVDPTNDDPAKKKSISFGVQPSSETHSVTTKKDSFRKGGLKKNPRYSPPAIPLVFAPNQEQTSTVQHRPPPHAKKDTLDYQDLMCGPIYSPSNKDYSVSSRSRSTTGQLTPQVDSSQQHVMRSTAPMPHLAYYTPNGATRRVNQPLFSPIQSNKNSAFAPSGHSSRGSP